MRKFIIRVGKIVGIGAGSLPVLIGLVIGGLYVAAPKPLAPPDTIQSVHDLDAYFEALTAQQTPPALTVRVLKHGEPVYAKAFGYADAPQQQPARIDTIYPWWSVTKVFTATAIMQLHERGLLDLDDPLRKFLPYFTVTDKDGTPKRIPIRQLLRHQSGLRDLMPDGLTWIRSEEQPGPNQSQSFQEQLRGRQPPLPSTRNAGGSKEPEFLLTCHSCSFVGEIRRKISRAPLRARH